MASYKCVCGHVDDEKVKCPKCGKMLVEYEEKPAKKAPVAKKAKK